MCPNENIFNKEISRFFQLRWTEVDLGVADTVDDNAREKSTSDFDGISGSSEFIVRCLFKHSLLCMPLSTPFLPFFL